MDKTKSRLAAFFDNDEDESSLPQKTVDDAKLSQYTAGKVRKSRREKEQEAAEAKKREEEANAAKAYAEFIDAFEGEDVGRRRGGTGFVKATTESGAAYAPDKPSTERQSRAGFSMNRSPSPPSNTAPKPKGKRAMDAFLEEIKRDQAEREAKYSRHAHGRSVTAMAAYEGQSGSKDRGDPQTSNVFVANLPPHVTEQTLGQFFARAGPVGSVKVMWPRTDASIGPGADMTASRRTKNAGLSGFVSFMKRKDAERALREFDGYDWGGSVLRVGWSKAVPIAAKPLYVSESARKRSRSRSRSRSRDRRRSHSRTRRNRSPSWSRSPSRSSRSRSPSSRGHMEEEEAVTDTFIRAVAAEVKGHGADYEENLRKLERNNPKFTFLHRDHRRYAFYRGLIESEEPPQAEFDDEGYNSVYSTDSAEESERERVRKTVLGRLARRRFESMLRALSGKRGEMARCMAFSLEHAEAAHEVADIIVASLLVDGTPVPRKVARLHLICDILHNSAAAVPSAWKFRLEFQSRLGIVFDHLANIYHSFPGRITAETFKKQITAVVDIWEDWIVFPPEFTAELRLRLDGSTKETTPPKPSATPEVAQKSEPEAYASRFKASTFKMAAPESGLPPANPGQDGEPMDVESDVDGEPVDDVDGEPVDDVDGEPLDDVDGEPVDDVDGVPLNDDMDGEPVHDDVDGVPMEDIRGK
ncbi:putative RPR [Lyophyllum shimeji]|uniref:RPR n=1 Tax=Lyophyllum shimeji TaxID=47721 RepID=A0A9P3PLH7_LYOSH|nr:putative RPR [Lyophyllum shimeji]